MADPMSSSLLGARPLILRIRNKMPVCLVYMPRGFGLISKRPGWSFDECVWHRELDQATARFLCRGSRKNCKLTFNASILVLEPSQLLYWLAIAHNRKWSSNA